MTEKNDIKIFPLVKIPLLLLISFMVMMSVSCSTQYAKVLKSKDNEYKLAQANQYYEKGLKYLASGSGSKANTNLNHAHELYDELLKTFLKGTPRYEETFYKYAMSSYNLKDYVEAEMTFKAYMDNFPTGSHIDEAYFLRGKSLAKASPRAELDQANTMKAISLLQAYLATFPNGGNAKEAASLLTGLQSKLEEKHYVAAELYFDRQQYLSAQVTFNSLIERFPESERGDEYAYKEALSAYLYAKNSRPYVQEERYKDAMESIQYFKTGYPESKYLKELLPIETLVKQDLENLKKTVINTQ